MGHTSVSLPVHLCAASFATLTASFFLSYLTGSAAPKAANSDLSPRAVSFTSRRVLSNFARSSWTSAYPSKKRPAHRFFPSFSSFLEGYGWFGEFGIDAFQLGFSFIESILFLIISWSSFPGKMAADNCSCCWWKWPIIWLSAFFKIEVESADHTVPSTAILSAWPVTDTNSSHLVELNQTIPRYFGEDVLDGLLGWDLAFAKTSSCKLTNPFLLYICQPKSPNRTQWMW